MERALWKYKKINLFYWNRSPQRWDPDPKIPSQTQQGELYCDIFDDA